MLIVGIDPGARESGIVARRGDQLVTAVTVAHAGYTNAAAVRVEAVDELLDALDALEELVYQAGAHVVDGRAVDGRIDGVAVEDVIGRWRRKPGAQGAATDPTPVHATAAAAGAAVAWARSRALPVVVVRPANAGQGRGGAAAYVWGGYPVELHDPAGCARSGRCSTACVAARGKRRHERAAWDVAGAGRFELVAGVGR